MHERGPSIFRLDVSIGTSIDQNLNERMREQLNKQLSKDLQRLDGAGGVAISSSIHESGPSIFILTVHIGARFDQNLRDEMRISKSLYSITR